LIFAGVPTLTLCTLGSYETKTKRKDNDIVPIVDPKRQHTENEGLRKTKTRRRNEPKKEEKQKNMQGNQSSVENGDRSPDFMPSPIISASGDLS
jgi:hypothetical protein